MVDNDLYAVIDNERSKSQQVVITQEEDHAKPNLDQNAVVSTSELNSINLFFGHFFHCTKLQPS